MDFYRGLGFEVTYQQAKPNNYAVVCYGSIGLKRTCGRVPSAGIPRIIPLKTKTSPVRREFIAVDPGGNWIRIGQAVETPAGTEGSALKTMPSTNLSKSLHVASILSDAGNDAEAASRLDSALAADEPGSVIQRVQALVYRAGLAINLGDKQHARDLLKQVKLMPLTDDDSDALVDELQRADDLEHVVA